jgi:AraC family transcriptional regulator
MSGAELPGFWSHLGRRLSLDAKGLGTSWVAPVAKLVAPDGFGENVWIDETPDTVVAVRLAGSDVAKSKGVCSGATTASGGNFTLQPKGTPNWFTAAGGCVFGQILLPDDLIDRASDAVGQAKLSGRLRPDMVFSNHRDLNRSALSYLERGLNPREPPTCLEMEGRAMLLLDTLLGAHGAARPTARSSGGLNGWQLRRVTDFMTEHVAQDLALDQLAALVNLSAKHFARAFRQSTGLPPHRWLIERRVERAKAMLVTAEVSLAEIALACGFADQSHFTAAFRKSVGATPGGYRREMRI